ncbi:MAG: hypothetical protein J6C60_01990 [Alistipes sp.]|nr:hypothetical protein [Alistipes sp.]
MRLTRKNKKNRTAEFAEEGRRVGGGLKNGDLLIASKVRSIHFTDDGATTPQIVPCGLFVQLFRKKLREKQFVSASFFHKGRFQSFSHRPHYSIRWEG